MNLCDIETIRAVLGRHGFHFSKSLGQNFLTDESVPRRIAEMSGAAECGNAIEVGPGMGCLSAELCRRADKVVAVELDRALMPVLAETLADYDNFEVVHGDVLETDLAALCKEKFGDGKAIACANLPYYITTPAITALLESGAFEQVTVMVQKEVAQRICSPAGKGDYGAFSVFCQYYAEPELLFDVPASCFIPQPKVTSAVLKLTMRKEPVCEIKSETMFFKVVRAAFAQRRKTLLNALSSGLSQFDKPALAAVIEDCGFAPTVRGETLDIPGFAAIANALTEL